MGNENLLLQGEIGIGKSTTIRDSVIPYMDFESLIGNY